MATVVRLLSSDAQQFTVDAEAAKLSVTIRNIMEELGSGDDSDEVIPVPNVSASALAKVVEFCRFQVLLPAKSDEERKAFQTEFLDVDINTLFDLVLAANYLDIKPMLDMTCGGVAAMLRGKTTEQMREILNIQNDLTPEEEEQLRRENEWAFEHQ